MNTAYAAQYSFPSFAVQYVYLLEADGELMGVTAQRWHCRLSYDCCAAAGQPLFFRFN